MQVRSHTPGARRVLAVTVTALALVAAACGSSSGEDAGRDAAATAGTPAAGGNAPKGGTFRVASTGFNFTGAWDPQAEYTYVNWEIYTGMLLRRLMSYRHVQGGEGTEPVPDLAAAPPQVSPDGLEYTFRLKEGVRFGPPVSREITSKDVAYAFERMADADTGASYAFYYTVIDGFEVEDDPGRIRGIRTPDDRTITFRLTEPTGDFLNRLALPATAPIPEEVARCHTKRGEYGRYVIASGPYMVEGSDELDVSSCDVQEPISGFDPNRRLSLVRNPEYDPQTDDPAIREANIDGLEWTLNSNLQDIFDRVERGELDGSWEDVPPNVLRQFATSGELRERLHTAPNNNMWPISMNLTQPPFDDVHVRKAMNWVIDKAALQRAAGGRLAYPIAQHFMVDVLEGGRLQDYRPYGTPGDAGDAERAKAEMRQSRYDTDGDGLCDADACRDVLLVTPNAPPATAMNPVMVRDAAKIGIELRPQEVADWNSAVGTVSRDIPIIAGSILGADYPDPYGFLVVLGGDAIVPEGNFNWPLLGLEPDQARELDVEGSVRDVPSIDAELARCQALAGDERLDCFSELDRTLMEDVAPWVPHFTGQSVTVTGPAVSRFQFSQSTGYHSLAHMALDAAAQRR